ncbi:CapA family protein [Streptococcus sp. H49]|uniref:CapA family protein n=1 Tax=Streptococcus huangxiaojuni TaxID=3237239 RepID=UPI0034A2DC30
MKKFRIIYRKTSLICLLILCLCLVLAAVFDLLGNVPVKKDNVKTEKKTARLVANGDILLHDILYTSARQEDGSYDFTPYFEYVKDWIDGADLAIGDYEGTICPDYPLGGYPLFNAPPEIAACMKDTGYDVVDLAHNHILDSQLAGALNTVDVFNNLGLDTIGIYKTNRAQEDFLIKDVKGIKIAILGYAYGYNGMEANLTEAEYEAHLSDLDEKEMKKEIKEAEEKADITIVMPQMGTEYALEPTDEQIKLYHKMVDWGADVVLGGHPHVAEPAEIVEKDGERKFIIYSMGNFISNQTYERMENVWPERGLLMDLTFEKTGSQTVIKTVKAHPTLVWSWGKGEHGSEGYEYFNYRVLILEDFIEGGRYRDLLDETMQTKVDQAYQEMTELVNLQWE